MRTEDAQGLVHPVVSMVSRPNPAVGTGGGRGALGMHAAVQQKFSGAG